MTEIIPVAGGKGGVGKTIVVANLALALARLGKTVIAVDLDLGASNLHTCLGIKNRREGIGHVIHQKSRSVASLVIPTDWSRLHFVPGDALLPGTANLPYFKKLRIIKDLSGLTADIVLVDLGAGSANNVVDFFLTACRGIVVVTPETTSILNAYAFLKNALFRALYRSFPPKSEGRCIVREFGTQRIEGSKRGFPDLVEELVSILGSEADEAERVIKRLFPRVILNMARKQEDVSIGARLRGLSERNLGIQVEYVSVLRHDELVPQSVIKRKPLVELAPNAPFSQDVRRTAERVVAALGRRESDLRDDDLQALEREL